MPPLFLLPDTNIFLHFPALSDVDWCSITGADKVIITVPPVVMRELNDHKDDPRSRKLRDRADAALKDFHARFKGQKPKELRPNVEIQFLTKDPGIDFAACGLLKELPDDWLIATAIDLAAQKPSETVAIVTADVGLEMKASTYLKVVEMPESLRLPEELNSDEKKIKELQRQLQTIQAASPDLKIVFADGAPFYELALFQYPHHEKMIDARIEEAKKKYPKQAAIPKMNVLGLDVSGIRNSLAQAYNQRVDEYIEELRKFWQLMSNAARWFNATAKVQLFIGNQGGAPAEDIDVVIHFPDGFDVVGEAGLPKLPEHPDPPQSMEDSIRSFGNPLVAYGPSAAQLNSLIPKPEPNSRLLDIKKTESHDVKFHVKRLKHQDRVQLPSLYLHFANAPMSFRAEYCLIAANVPLPSKGTLDFVWKVKPAKGK